MPVDAYVIIRDKSPGSSDYLRAFTGPYLFRSEAEKYAGVITAVTSRHCRLNIIATDRMLSEVVRLNDSWIVTNVWRIGRTSGGFEGDVIVAGRSYRVRRSDPDKPWHLAEKSLEGVGPQ